MDRRGKDSKVNEKRLLCHRRGVIALVASVALAFVIGFGVLGLQPTGTSMGNGPDGASEFAVPVSGNDAASGERDDSFQVSSDPRYGDIETGKVLVHVDGTMSIRQVNSVLGSLDFAVTKDVSGQDATIGFVEVEIDDSVSVPQALDIFEDEGLSAQPNYVYYLAESEQDSVLVEHAASAFDLQTSLQSATATGAAADPTVASVSINDPSAGQEWYLESMDLYKAWGIQTSEQSRNQQRVSVAVIDSGCLVTHEDLKDNIVATYNSVTGAEGPDHVQDDGGHGTHVAGIVSARANNGVGTAGTSYNAGLVIIKGNTLNDKNEPAFSTTHLAQAYAWLMGDSGNGQTVAQRHNLRVVNMSLGGPATVNMSNAEDKALYDKITQAKSAGILTVCAAGNSTSKGIPPYNVIPGDYADCFTVINLMQGSGAANDSSGTHYVERNPSSNYNVASGDFAKAKSISAPGSIIYSTTFDGESSYGSKTGTSMASPATAGVAALMFAYDPSLSAADVQSLLEQTATDINEQGWDRETGYGEVDAYHALQVLSAQIGFDTISYKGSTKLTVACPDGSSLPASEWTWTSDNPDVILVNETDGVARAGAVGTATVTATHPAGREISKQITVVPADLSQAQIASIQDQVYSGSAIEPSVRVSLNGEELAAGVDYTVSYANNVNAGSDASVTVTGMGSHYSGSTTTSFAIAPFDLNGAVVEGIPQQGWNGTPATPVPVIRHGSIELVGGRDFEVSYENNTGLGNARVIVSGIGNYAGTLVREFVIARTLRDDFVSPIDSCIYTGHEIKPAVTLVDAGTPLARDVDYKVSYADNTSAGMATAIITGIGNYAGEIRATFAIEPKDLSSASLNVADQTYTGEKITPDVTASIGDIPLVRDVDYEVYYSNNQNVGTATVSIEGMGNYKGSKDAYFDITGLPMSSLLISVNGAPTYSGRAIEPAITVRDSSGVLLRESIDYVIDGYENNVNAGDNTGVVKVRGIGNYHGDARASFTIKQAHLSNATVSIDPQQYTGSPITPEPVVVLNGHGTLARNRDYTVTYRSNTNVGTAGVTIAGMGNYSGTKNVFFSITSPDPAPAPDPQPAEPAPIPVATGSWVWSGGWWFSYDGDSQARTGKAYPAGEWVSVNGARYHFDGAGWMHSGWLSLDGAWYWLGPDGAMKTGWHLVGGAWYYMGSDGAMWTGKRAIGGATYYLSGSGAMRTGWSLEGSTWYYYDPSGAMARGWRYAGGAWYFLDGSTGAMRQYWLDEGGQRYFLLSSGAMLTGWASIDGTWYYFAPSGAMQRDRWIGNYYVGSDGAMATNAWIGRYHVNESGLWDATR